MSMPAELFARLMSSFKNMDPQAYELASLSVRIASNIRNESNLLIYCSDGSLTPEMGAIFKIAERCINVFRQEDEPRFTVEDLVDALCFKQEITPMIWDMLISDQCPDNMFSAVAIGAAEAYRTMLGKDIVSAPDEFYGNLKKLRALFRK